MTGTSSTTIAMPYRLTWQWDDGMGSMLDVEPVAYGAAYLKHYVDLAATPMGRKLTELRADLVRRHTHGAVLDVGIGAGQFIEACPDTVYGYDVNPFGVVWLKDRHLWRDPHEQATDALTFWDSIEHIRDVRPMLANAREWVFASLPIVPGNGPPTPEWKHFKPGEHLWYWTHYGFRRWMQVYGFEFVESNTFESDAGREDIESFAFRRVA